jgi:hypothetical protein
MCQEILHISPVAFSNPLNFNGKNSGMEIA